MRILVTGPRDWKDRPTLAAALREVAEGVPSHEVTLVHGGARGFDTLAGMFAVNFGWNVDIYFPDYKHHGQSAPLLRNQAMVDTGADICVAGYMPCSKPGCKRPNPHGTHGTADCVRRAKKAGIPLKTIEPVVWM